MSDSTLPFLDSILHPSDLSEASERAFAHALAIALVRQAQLSILHVGPVENSWGSMPAVRGTLERWGLLDPDSPRYAVFQKLGIRVDKLAVRSRSPVATILEQLEERPTDLIVLATEGREGMPRWIRGSVAESVARRSETVTLFVPSQARGFVAVEDGRLSLRRILIPVDHAPDPRAAITFATRAAHAFGESPVLVTLLHVGESEPVLDALPEDPAWQWKRLRRDGSPVDVIAEESRQQDLLVMVTEGRDGVLDALRGTTTEQVLRRVQCPVLAVPMAWVGRVTRGEDR